MRIKNKLREYEIKYYYLIIINIFYQYFRDKSFKYCTLIINYPKKIYINHYIKNYYYPFLETFCNLEVPKDKELYFHS